MIDLTPLTRLGLLLVRPGALILSAPTFGGVYAPAQVKVGLTVLIAVLLLPIAPTPPVGAPVEIMLLVLRELMIGLALSMAIRALVAAAEFAGHMVGFQMGLSYSAIVDPQSGVRNNVIASLYTNVAVVTFFMLNGHHAFLRALSDSFIRLPVGAGHVDAAVPAMVVRMLALVFSLGARLAAPLVIVLIVVEIGMALVSRAAPSMNLMVVGAPVRLLVGLMLLSFVIPPAVGVVRGMMATVLQLGTEAAGAFR